MMYVGFHRGSAVSVEGAAAGPAVAQQGVHVGVPGDVPVIGVLVEPDRLVLAELRVDRVRVGDERGDARSKAIAAG